MSKEMKKALREIAEVLAFEHWLRFYFVVERDEKLFIEIPEERLAYIQENMPGYTGLVNMLNHREISYQSSCDTVCSFLASAFDGTRYKPGTVSQILDSRELKLELHLFSLWLKGFEGKLEQEEYDFEAWQLMFREWLDSDEVKRFAGGLSTLPGLECAPGPDTMH
jgi:hypothetical protein